jgi:hypothetical protein
METRECCEAGRRRKMMRGGEMTRERRRAQHDKEEGNDNHLGD